MKSWLIYIGAFIAALMGYYVATRFGGELTFGGMPNAGILFSWAAPPLAALALFALAYGLGHGRTLKAAYWLGGLALMMVSSFLLLALIFFGDATRVEAAVIVTGAVLVVGRLLIRRVEHA